MVCIPWKTTAGQRGSHSCTGRHISSKRLCAKPEPMLSPSPVGWIPESSPRSTHYHFTQKTMLVLEAQAPHVSQMLRLANQHRKALPAPAGKPDQKSCSYYTHANARVSLSQQHTHANLATTAMSRPPILAHIHICTLAPTKKTSLCH
jgi:hypothetical protein